ncbi:MAG: alpha/beta fold hydrolase [Bryobacteraceae bacterium]
MARRIETHLLTGPAGRLESLLEEPEDRDPIHAALVCHPHPQHGGTMHNKVVYRMARALRKAGAVVLRFNYRGVNLSEGSYANGIGEVDDARAALAWLRSRYPDLPYTLAGFSFGSRIVLRLAKECPDAARVIAVGFPARYQDYSDYLEAPVQRVFVQSTRDEFGPRPEFERFFESVAGEKQLVWVESGDHFFSGALDAFEGAVLEASRTA